MPTYEYECKSCGHRFEAFQSMSDEPIKKCPECGKTVRRLVSGGAGVIFKGSGFYVTDKDKSSVPKGGTISKKDDSSSGSGSKGGDGASSGSGSKVDSTPKADTPKAGAKDGGAKGKAKPAA